jgi:hypothetical protein
MLRITMLLKFPSGHQLGNIFIFSSVRLSSIKIHIQGNKTLHKTIIMITSNIIFLGNQQEIGTKWEVIL